VTTKENLDSLATKGVFLLATDKSDADLLAKFREVGLANADQFNFALLGDNALVGATPKSLWFVKGDEKKEIAKEVTSADMESLVQKYVEDQIPLVGPVNEEN